MDAGRDAVVRAAGRNPEGQDRPAVHVQIDNLEKLLHEAYSQSQRIDCGVNRIRVEPVPTATAPAQDRGANNIQPTVEVRLRELASFADRLVSELNGIGIRLDRFV